MVRHRTFDHLHFGYLVRRKRAVRDIRNHNWTYFRKEHIKSLKTHQSRDMDQKIHRTDLFHSLENSQLVQEIYCLTKRVQITDWRNHKSKIKLEKKDSKVNKDSEYVSLGNGGSDIFNKFYNGHMEALSNHYYFQIKDYKFGIEQVPWL